MHDLRYDADAHAPDARAYSLPTVKALPAESLRTVPMPDLRSPEARLLEAARRGMDGDGHAPDVRTFDQVVISELVRLVDTIQTLSLRQDVFEEELGARRDAIDARLSRLEDSLKRVADGLQVLILRLDDGK